VTAGEIPAPEGAFEAVDAAVDDTVRRPTPNDLLEHLVAEGEPREVVGGGRRGDEADADLGAQTAVALTGRPLKLRAELRGHEEADVRSCDPLLAPIGGSGQTLMTVRLISQSA
jgi:hypothetical protein